MDFKDDNNPPFADEVRKLIVKLRRRINVEENWPRFRNLIESNIEHTCSALNTRWLISVADTYADYGDKLEKRNALYISMLANFEKLAASRLLMYDLNINPTKLENLKKNRSIELWDGMFSFNINRGDMINNLFYRIRSMLKETPFLETIFETVLNRILLNDTVLANIYIYHYNILANPKKRSILKGINKRIRSFFARYRLF